MEGSFEDELQIIASPRKSNGIQISVTGSRYTGSGTIMSARAFDAILCQTTYTPEVS